MNGKYVKSVSKVAKSAKFGTPGIKEWIFIGVWTF